MSCFVTAIDAERAVFTGLADVEPIKAGFQRDKIILHKSGFQLLNGEKPYRNFQDHVFGQYGYGIWPHFFPEIISDIHPEIVDVISANNFTLSITLDPNSAKLKPNTEQSGQRFGVYLQFDHGQALGGAYLIFGFDGIGEDLQPVNRPFALVGQGYWTYYIDPRDRTGFAETLTLVRRGDVFQLYTSSAGTSFVGVAGQRADGRLYPDLNGTLATKPSVIKDLGPNPTLTALTLWTESDGENPFDAGAGRLQALVIESDALQRDINPNSHVPPVPALPPNQTYNGSLVEFSGVVENEVSGERINYAHVAIQQNELSYVVITDAEGRFSATLVPGTYQIEVTAKGFQPIVNIAQIDAATEKGYLLSDLAVNHHVGPDRTLQTIQSALEVANDGDTIHLDPGTYEAPLQLQSNISIRGAGADQTRLVKQAYRDVAMTPFLAEYFPPYGTQGVVLKAALSNVDLSGFTLDGGDDYETLGAETVSERLKLLMAIDRVDLKTVTNMLEANPALAKVRYYTEDSPQTGATFLTRNIDPWVKWTPDLHADNVAIAKLLIENGADIEGFGGYAWSAGGRPLHIAANHDNVGVIRLLLKAGANPNSLAGERTPIEWAVSQSVRVAAAAAELIDGGANYTLLDLARLKLMDRLERELGSQINNLFPVPDAEPTSLLHVAVRDNLHDVVAWLLERGADPNLVDANGLTPKDVAKSIPYSRPLHILLAIKESL